MSRQCQLLPSTARLPVRDLMPRHGYFFSAQRNRFDMAFSAADALEMDFFFEDEPADQDEFFLNNGDDGDAALLSDRRRGVDNATNGNPFDNNLLGSHFFIDHDETFDSRTGRADQRSTLLAPDGEPFFVQRHRYDFTIRRSAVVGHVTRPVVAVLYRSCL